MTEPLTFEDYIEAAVVARWEWRKDDGTPPIAEAIALLEQVVLVSPPRTAQKTYDKSKGNLSVNRGFQSPETAKIADGVFPADFRKFLYQLIHIVKQKEPAQ